MQILHDSEWITEYEHYVNVYMNDEIIAGFPCDENGELVKDKNYNFWFPNYLRHRNDATKEFRHEIEKRTYKRNAIGICECGHEIELYNEYFGACECGYCGRWHNLFGQLLKKPSQWEECY